MTKLASALMGVATLGFDTAPLIYFVERHPAYLDLIRAVIRQVDTGQIAGYTSVVTLTEVLTAPKRAANKQIESQYLELLQHSRHFTYFPLPP